MKKLCLAAFLVASLFETFAQDVAGKLEESVNNFMNSAQMRHASLSFVVIDAGTGKVVYEKNGNTGLAPASTLKVVTSVTAFEVLGSSFRYSTDLFYTGRIPTDGGLDSIYIVGSGDPSLGSPRWKETSSSQFISSFTKALQQKQVRTTAGGKINYVNTGYTLKAFPDGWIWQDIGNYYGAGHSYLNWNENSFEIRFIPGGSKGAKVVSAAPVPAFIDYEIDISEMRTGARGSGDSAYVYLKPNSPNSLFLAGSIPAGENNFTIKAAHPDPVKYFHNFVKTQDSARKDSLLAAFNNSPAVVSELPANATLLFRYQSPVLDSLNFWFMRRSINLYGEAFLKTIAKKETGFASTEIGVEFLQRFWKDRGIDEGAFHILDGSGLSPQNRISADALTRVLYYARDKQWYKSFYQALPLINGMKMKSGSILGARAYAGHHTSKAGKQYIFAMIINNYHGSGQMVSRSMWRVLDGLK